MKLPRSIKNLVTKGKNSENMTPLEITEVILVHCNIAYNDYQQYLRVLYRSVPNKLSGHLTDISHKHFAFQKFNSEVSCIEVWFNDQSSKPLEIEDEININLIIN